MIRNTLSFCPVWFSVIRGQDLAAKRSPMGGAKPLWDNNDASMFQVKEYEGHGHPHDIKHVVWARVWHIERDICD
jgi:hypothetical protein